MPAPTEAYMPAPAHPHGNQAQHHSIVGVQLAVERAHGLGVPRCGRLGSSGLACHSTLSTAISPPGRRQHQRPLVVIRVVPLSASMKANRRCPRGLRQPTRPGFPSAGPSRNSILSSTPGLAPRAPGADHVLRVAVASHKLSAGRQGQRHPSRAVSHEGPYFERFPGAQYASHEVQELPLLGTDLDGTRRAHLPPLRAGASTLPARAASRGERSPPVPR